MRASFSLPKPSIIRMADGSWMNKETKHHMIRGQGNANKSHSPFGGRSFVLAFAYLPDSFSMQKYIGFMTEIIVPFA